MMMNNGSNVPAADGAAYNYNIPSSMTPPPFVGLEAAGTTQRQIQFWDWDSTGQPSNHVSTSSFHVSSVAHALDDHTFTGAAAGSNISPYLDYLQQTPIPAAMTTCFPYYTTSMVLPVPPDYHHHHQQGPAGGIVIKREEAAADQFCAGQIGLNLGHRTYFSSGDALAIDRLFRRSRGIYQVSHQVPRCQAEGCKADLSDSKHYHRRHKVCEFHSKATVVVAGGLQQRFCQQCSRFHVLSEFDEAKRSCRKRLADHNRRRRKPQPTPAAQASGSPDKSKQITCLDAMDICTAAAGGGAGTSKAGTTTTATTATSASTFSTSNMSTGSQRETKAAAHLRNGPALSLGGVDQGGYYRLHHGERSPFVFMPEEVSSRNQHQQQRLSSPIFPSSSSFSHHHLAHHNFFCSSSSDASHHSTPCVGSDVHADAQNNLLHLGQGLFEVDFNHFM